MWPIDKAAKLAILAFALAVSGCEDNPGSPTAAQPVSLPPPTTAPAPQASPSPLPGPLAVTESVTFRAGSTEARTKAFAVDVRRQVVVTVGCHQTWPPELVKVDVLTEVGERVVSGRCKGGGGFVGPGCQDIGVDVELDPGTYVVRLQREDRYSAWWDYPCLVSVEGP